MTEFHQAVLAALNNAKAVPRSIIVMHVPPTTIHLLHVYFVMMVTITSVVLVYNVILRVLLALILILAFYVNKIKFTYNRGFVLNVVKGIIQFPTYA